MKQNSAKECEKISEEKKRLRLWSLSNNGGENVLNYNKKKEEGILIADIKDILDIFISC